MRPPRRIRSPRAKREPSRGSSLSSPREVPRQRGRHARHPSDVRKLPAFMRALTAGSLQTWVGATDPRSLLGDSRPGGRACRDLATCLANAATTRPPSDVRKLPAFARALKAGSLRTWVEATPVPSRIAAD